MNEEDIGKLGGFFCCGSMFLAFTVPIAVQAWRRGYSFWLWIVVCVVVINPIIFLVTLALMPNRARQRLRVKFRKELDAKLASQPIDVIPIVVIGSPSVGSTLTGDRSLGDLPTMMPRERSVGDDETRG